VRRRDRKKKNERVTRQSTRSQNLSDSEGGSSGHDRPRSTDRGLDRKGTKKVDEAKKEDSPISLEEKEEEEGEAECSGQEALTKKGPGRGRRYTTGEYKGQKEELRKLNDERQREINLKREERIVQMNSSDLLKLNKINSDEVMEEAEQSPIADIVNQIRECQANVLRVSKCSSNLKGTSQNLLNEAAGHTLGFVEALRTRLDRILTNNGQMEIQALQKEQENLRKNTEERIRRMEEALKQALQKADAEKQKANHHLNLLI